MKQKLLFIILGLVFLIVIKPYFHQGVPYTHDGENHLARFANYKLAIKEGQFPPRFAPNLMNHYGYPVLNYNYPLLNILSLPLSAINLHYELSFKLLMVAGLGVGAWGVWSWLTACGFSKSARLVATISYLLAPFVINLIFVRGNIGELWSIALFPWLLWFTKQLKLGKEVSWLVSIPLIVAFLLAHNISVLFGGVAWFLYTLNKFGLNKKLWWRWLKPTLLAMMMSLWFWLPAYLEKNLIVVSDAKLSSQFADHFVNFGQLVFSTLEFGYSFETPVDTLSFSVGLTGFVSLVVVSLWLLKTKLVLKEKANHWVLPLVIAGWLLLFFQTSFSKIIWQLVPLVQFIQFPWRLTSFFVVLSLPIIATAYQLNKPIKIILLACLLTQLIATARFQPVAYFHKPVIEYDLFPQSTSTLNENLVKGFTYLEIGDWQPAPKAIEGEIQATVGHWTGSERAYDLTVTTSALVVEPTMNFLGWETQVNGQKINYLERTDETAGRISYRLEPGNYQVTSRFTQRTWPRIIGNSLSLGAFLIWTWLIWQEKRTSFGKSSR